MKTALNFYAVLALEEAFFAAIKTLEGQLKEKLPEKLSDDNQAYFDGIASEKREALQELKLLAGATNSIRVWKGLFNAMEWQKKQVKVNNAAKIKAADDERQSKKAKGA